MLNLLGQIVASRAQMQQADIMRMNAAEAHLRGFREHNPGKPIDEKTLALVTELSRPRFSPPVSQPSASGCSWTTIAVAFLFGAAIS